MPAVLRVSRLARSTQAGFCGFPLGRAAGSLAARVPFSASAAPAAEYQYDQQGSNHDVRVCDERRNPCMSAPAFVGDLWKVRRRWVGLAR
jgi:hypothetical protein